jgi:hypothetical protein
MFSEQKKSGGTLSKSLQGIITIVPKWDTDTTIKENYKSQIFSICSTINYNLKLKV